MEKINAEYSLTPLTVSQMEEIEGGFFKACKRDPWGCELCYVFPLPFPISYSCYG